MTEEKRPHIMVVEDEAIVSMQITRTLRKLDYTVCSAPSGEEAIKLAKTESPDLALMDIMLAGSLDGIQTAAYLSRHHGTPIVYLTANADESTVNRAKLTEPYGYILKPFQESRLRNSIDVALQRHAMTNRFKKDHEAFQPVFETSEDAIFTADVEGHLIFMNLAAETLIKAKLDQIRGTELISAFAPFSDEQRTILKEAMAQASATGSEVALAKHGMKLSANGAPALSAHSVVPIGRDKESITGVVLIFRGGAAAGASRNPNSRDSAPSSIRTIAPSQETRKLNVTGLPSRAEAERSINTAIAQGTHRFAAAFLLDRFDLIRHRFGPKAAEEVLVFYSIHLAQAMGPTDLLFQWTGPSFLMLLDRAAAALEVRREIATWAGVRLEKIVEATSHSAMLVVSGNWKLYDTAESHTPENLIQSIDVFLGLVPAK